MDIQKKDETQVPSEDDQREGDYFTVRKGMMNLVLERLNLRCLWNCHFHCCNVYEFNVRIPRCPPLHNSK